jgi:signal transduction histidine kinase
VVLVKDTGIGIGPEDQTKIFDRFYRVDKARSRDAGGTGLGLSIARTLAEAHNGTLTVKSIINEGSEFRLTLPLG